MVLCSPCFFLALSMVVLQTWHDHWRQLSFELLCKYMPLCLHNFLSWKIQWCLRVICFCNFFLFLFDLDECSIALNWDSFQKMGSSGQQNATRCGLWWVEMLKTGDQYKEAATVYFRICDEVMWNLLWNRTEQGNLFFCL